MNSKVYWRSRFVTGKDVCPRIVHGLRIMKIIKIIWQETMFLDVIKYNWTSNMRIFTDSDTVTIISVNIWHSRNLVCYLLLWWSCFNESWTVLLSKLLFPIWLSKFRSGTNIREFHMKSICTDEHYIYQENWHYINGLF